VEVAHRAIETISLAQFFCFFCSMAVSPSFSPAPVLSPLVLSGCWHCGRLDSSEKDGWSRRFVRRTARYRKGEREPVHARAALVLVCQQITLCDISFIEANQHAEEGWV
jgi:hypothetical protein